MEFDHPVSSGDGNCASQPEASFRDPFRATLLGGALRYRRLGDAGVVFDNRDWRTHVLSAGSAAVLELMLEHVPHGCMSEAELGDLLLAELDLDPGQTEVREILASLRKLGILA